MIAFFSPLHLPNGSNFPSVEPPPTIHKCNNLHNLAIAIFTLPFFAKLSKDQKKTLRDIQRKLESGGFSQSDFNTQIRSIAKSLGIDTNDRSLMSVAKDVESALGISL